MVAAAPLQPTLELPERAILIAGDPEKSLRLFACWGAEVIQGLLLNPDPRCVAVIEAKRQALLRGKITVDELLTTYAGARSATREIHNKTWSDIVKGEAVPDDVKMVIKSAFKSKPNRLRQLVRTADATAQIAHFAAKATSIAVSAKPAWAVAHGIAQLLEKALRWDHYRSWGAGGNWRHFSSESPSAQALDGFSDLPPEEQAELLRLEAQRLLLWELCHDKGDSRGILPLLERWPTTDVGEPSERPISELLFTEVLSELDEYLGFQQHRKRYLWTEPQDIAFRVNTRPQSLIVGLTSTQEGTIAGLSGKARVKHNALRYFNQQYWAWPVVWPTAFKGLCPKWFKHKNINGPFRGMEDVVWRNKRLFWFDPEKDKFTLEEIRERIRKCDDLDRKLKNPRFKTKYFGSSDETVALFLSRLPSDPKMMPHLSVLVGQWTSP